MVKKATFKYKMSVLLLILVMFLNINAYSIYSVAEGISSLPENTPQGSVTGSDQTIGEGDPTLGEITIPTVTKNPYRPTVHKLVYPVLRSDHIYSSDSLITSVETNGYAKDHSRAYTASLSALIGYGKNRGYYQSIATQGKIVRGMRRDTLNPDLYVSGQELGFSINTGSNPSDDYTNFLASSYVYDYLHLNKDHLKFTLSFEQAGMSHVKMQVIATNDKNKSTAYNKETTSDGDIETISVPLKGVTSLSGKIDAFSYNGAFYEVTALLIDDTSPSVNNIEISQQIHENDDADLVMKMAFNEGIRFADLRERSATKYLDSMWVEVEIEEVETGKLSKVRLYTSDVGTDCTMTFKANIGRYHYKQYRVNRISNVGFEENVSLSDYTMTAIDVTAAPSDAPDKALYPMTDATSRRIIVKYDGYITPITDIAGNSINLDSVINWQFGDQFNTYSFGIEEIQIYNDKTLGVAEGNIDEDNLLPEDLFIGATTEMTVMLYMSRILTESQWKKISVKLNLIGPDGNPIVITPTRALEYSRNRLYDNGTVKGSILVFENILLPKGTVPDVEAGGDPIIRVTELINNIPEYNFYPYFDHPITDMRADLTSPTVALRLVDDKMNENEGDRYYTAVLELSLADVVNYKRVAGLVGGEITVDLGAGVEDEVDFKYLFGTEATPPTDLTGYTGAATLTKNGYARIGHLNLISDTAKLYLHLLIEEDGIYIDDLKVDVKLTDAVGNLNDQKDVPITVEYLVDEVAPEVMITSKNATAAEENTKMIMNVGVSASDPSTVARIEYFVGDDPNAEGVEWSAALMFEVGTDVTAEIKREYGGLGSDTNGVINEMLWVRAVDYYDNVSEPVSTLINLNVEKPSTKARLFTDGNAVRTDHMIVVSGPDRSSDGIDAYTRVTITPISGGDFAYVVLVKTGEEVDLLDFENVSYYKVETQTDVNTTTYTTVDGPLSYVHSGALSEDHPFYDILTYYGELKISFENGYGDMTPVVGERTYDAANDGSYYKDPNYMTVRFASPFDEGRVVHSLEFGKVVNRYDELITDKLSSDSDPIVIYQSEVGFNAMRNMQIHFAISNIANASFGYLDLDYENSYAEFFLVSEDGDDVLMNRINGLSASANQYFTVSNTADNGDIYKTGAYYLRVTVKSLSGHEDVFESGIIVLDAQTADSAGVWEYSYFSPSNIKSINDPASYSAVVIERDPDAEDYITSFGISVLVGGETMRSRLFAAYSYGASSLTVELSAPNTVKTVAGVEVGNVSGFKVWNILSNPTTEEIDSAPFLLDYRSDTLSVYNNLRNIYDKDTIPKGSDAIGELHLVKGVNTFCYQAKLENGYVTPIRYFTVTVTDKAPTLNIAIDDYIPSHKASTVSGVVNIDSIRMFVETAYTFNGSGKLDVQLWSTYAMNLGLYGEDGYLTESYHDRDNSGEELTGMLTILKKGLKEGEYAVLTENSYTSDFPHYNSLCTAVFVAVDEYGGTTIIAPQLGNAQRHRVYGGVAYEKEYNISYVGQYYDDPYVLDDNLISWRFIYNEASYNGNILLGFESYLVHNVDGEETKVRDINTADEALGRNLFHISSNDIVPHSVDIETDYGSDKSGALIQMIEIENGDLITEKSTITISGDGIDGEVTLPLFEPNTEYGYLGASVKKYGSEQNRTVGLEFGFANPMANAENPAGTEKKLTYKLTLDNGYGESFSTPEYRVIGGVNSGPNFAGDISLYYIDYNVRDIVMTESGAELILSFATSDGMQSRIRVGKFNPNPEAGSDGKYTVSVTDLFGIEHELEYTIDPSIVADVQSKVTIDNIALTSKPVTVTIERDGGAPIYVDIVDYDIMSVEGNGTSKVTVNLTSNARFSYRYIGSEGEELIFYVSIDNIVLPNVTVSYNRDVELPVVDPATGEEFLYGDITVYLSDPNFRIVDAATGLPAQFTFTPGGAMTYTYPAGSLIAKLGGADDAESTTLGEITVSIKYPLREIPNPYEAETDDTVAPALQVLAYSNHAGVWSDEGLALQLTSRRGMFAFTEYSEYTTFAFSGERANMEKLLSKMGWSTSYRFLFEIQDDSRVRLFVKEGLYAEAPAFENGISDPIDGVELNSRLLTVSRAAKFTVFAVDAKGNASSVAFDVNNVGEAPAPTVKKIPIDGGVRAYLITPDGAEDLEILSVGITVGIETADGEFKGLPYVDIKKNDSYEILYKMKYNGNEIQPTTIDVSVSELRPDEITLSGNVSWSANKISEATATEIVAMLLFSDTVTKIMTATDYDKENVIFTSSGNQVTVTYKDNSEPISFRCYADNGSYVQVELDAVTNIDRTAPIITYEKQLASDAKSMTIVIKVNERATFKEGGGFVGELVDGEYVYRRVVTENTEYTYTFVDMSGISASVTIAVSELVLDPLTVEFSKSQDGSDSVSDPKYLEDLTVGDTVFVKPSRDAELQLSDGQLINIKSGEWSPITIPESLGGISPYVTVIDEYDNVYIGQFSSIIPLDTSPPELVINKDVWTVRAGSDRAELEAALIANAAAFDDSGEAITVEVEFPESIQSVGVYDVRYSATDSSGNSSELYGRLKIVSIYDPLVYLGDIKIDRNDGVYLTEGDEFILTVNSAGVEFDVYFVAGRKTAAQLKGMTPYEKNSLGGEISLGELDAGIYTVVIVTAEREYFSFIISVSAPEPGTQLE